jgi:hypothetical protein
MTMGLAGMEHHVLGVVLRHLEEITKIPRGEIRPTDRIVRDLRADSDDLSFLFIPNVERELGVGVKHDVWRRVVTVQDAVDALRQALRECQASA